MKLTNNLRINSWIEGYNSIDLISLVQSIYPSLYDDVPCPRVVPCKSTAQIWVSDPNDGYKGSRCSFAEEDTMHLSSCWHMHPCPLLDISKKHIPSMISIVIPFSFDSKTSTINGTISLRAPPKFLKAAFKVL